MGLPALQAGGEPREIVSALLDALVGMLRLAFVCVRLNDPEAEGSIEMMRFAESLAGAAEADLSLASARLGLQGEIGILVAGSQKPDFPADTDRLLLNVAVNQAAIALQKAHVSAERKRADEARRATGRESRAIVDSIPGLVALLTATGDIEVVNPRYSSTSARRSRS